MGTKKPFYFDYDKYYSGLTPAQIKLLVNQVAESKNNIITLICLVMKTFCLITLLKMHDKLIDRIKEKDYQEYVKKNNSDSQTDVDN